MQSDQYKDRFIWDKYSDQPQVIKDKQFKKAMRKRYLFDFLKMALSSMFIFPLSVLLMNFTKRDRSVIFDDKFYGVGVNLDKGDAQQQLIEELGAKSLIVRVPLNDIENIKSYYTFVKSFLKKSEDKSGYDKEILINIIQDREHIENTQLLKKDITTLFDTFKDIAFEYQVGTTINRAKWGFFAVEEYLKFYKIVEDIKEKNFKDLKLIGPSVIDFEYHYTIRALFNNYDIKFDKISSLLYVDRRGSPYSKQMGIFDTLNKIKMLYTLVKLSSKSQTDSIYITEVNWPISNTAPYAPTSEKECVNEELYTQYMLEYFQIAKQSQKIQKVFWHQLIAPGYGLVDNREGKLIKREAFYELQKIIQYSSNNI